MKPILTILTFSVLASAASAAELELMRIRSVEQTETENGVQVTVTSEVHTCRFDYKGVYLERIETGHDGLHQFSVRSLASDRGTGDCDGPIAPVRDTFLLSPRTAGKYEFTAVQPR